MSYEEIDRSNYSADVFTGGAEGRYAKPQSPSADSPSDKTVKRKTKTPKIDPLPPADHPAPDVEQTAAKSTTKTKSRKVKENGNDTTQATASAVDGELAVKPKKTAAPKDAPNIENIDPVLPVSTDEPVRKRQNKAPKPTPIEDNLQTIDTSPIEQTDIIPKVKKPKKLKEPKTTADPSGDVQTMNPDPIYYTSPEVNGETAPSDLTEIKQVKSDYESAIITAYDDLSKKMNFAQYVGEDRWTVVHLPKSARAEPKSRIRKLIPGKKDDKAGLSKTPNSTNGFMARLRTGVGTLVRNENNLLFGEQSNFEAVQFEEEEDGVDTDDLHRYAQRLRELEDADREVNPEFIVIRDGKTSYGVHEADADGKIKLSTRKPIYDRSADQAPDNVDGMDKRTLLARLKNPFNRTKDKDGKGSNSPRSVAGTPDQNGKRGSRKAAKKNDDNNDDDMVTI